MSSIQNKVDYDHKYDVLYCRIDDTSNSYGDEIDSNIILLKDMDTEEITGITVLDFKRNFCSNEKIGITLNQYFDVSEILTLTD